MEEDRSSFNILTGKPTGNGLLGRHRLKWEDHIIIDIKGIGVNTRKSTDSAQEMEIVSVALSLWFT